MKKVLLSSVFGPYGVDDEFGRKENIMELFHNQVTREQGVFSLRMNHPSFGLHLIAENLSIPAVVLDFPGKARFIEEIKKGYDYVGLSFIVPNFLKAKHMADLIRKYSPKSKIVLGGHGTSIEDIETLISCDHVCRGDGVRFMRELIGNDVEAKINHPLLLSAFNKHFLGAPGNKNAGVIMTGVGCVNACRFCCTTHYFQKKYTPFLKTGKEIFDLCVRMEEKHGVNEFFVMDENFLKSEERARELLHLMEKNNKAFSFSIFSSAEAVTRMGVDFMERLGVNFIWIGVESKREVFEKNKGVDVKALIKKLRDHGISVLASGILFLEHHTKQSMQEDVDFMVNMNADFVQFMQLGPLPGTELYRSYDKMGILRKDVPYEEWHGQKQIWFKHPHFTGPESEEYLKKAFRHDFNVNGPSVLRMIDTAIRGVYSIEPNAGSDFMKKRLEQRIERAMEIYPLLSAIYSHAPTGYARELARSAKKMYLDYFKKIEWTSRLESAAVQVFIFKEKFRSLLIENNMRQPKLMLTPYRMTLEKLKDTCFSGKIFKGELSVLRINTGLGNLPIQMKLSGMLDSVNIKALQDSLVKFLKKEDQKIVLNLSNLHFIEEEALRQFFVHIKEYGHRFQVIYSKNVESTKAAIDRLMKEFETLKFVPA